MDEPTLEEWVTDLAPEDGWSRPYQLHRLTDGTLVFRPAEPEPPTVSRLGVGMVWAIGMTAVLIWAAWTALRWIGVL